MAMPLTDVIGYIAASLVFATFCTKRMVPLRMLAIASNLGFISYGSLLGLWPIVALHTGMLPMNVLRLRQELLPPLRERTGCFVALAQRVAEWRERAHQRREIAVMRERDFGDIIVPPGLIVEEARRWPWQRFSIGWSAMSAAPRLDDR
jgi:uncharacterized protein YjiS (DUF1127 family)